MARAPADTPPLPRGPFSRPLRVREVSGTSGLDRHIEATAAECAGIALEFGFPAIASIKADLHIVARAGGRFQVSGTVTSVLTQICVVTLDPFESALQHGIDVGFVLPPQGRPNQTEHASRVEVDIEAGEDVPDTIVDNTIDLGAVALEFLALACDPYPKKPGVHFTDVLVGEKDAEDPSPFAAPGRFKDPS